MDLSKFKNLGLSDETLKTLQKKGFEEPTEIQEKTIPVLLKDNIDIIGQAQTGTGKTAAFILPILNKLLNGPRGMPRALIVTPTRELAEQIHDVTKMLSAGTKIRSATIYGGVSANRQIQELKRGVEILVACPGRLLDLVNQRHAKLDRIEVLVLDEADRIANEVKMKMV